MSAFEAMGCAAEPVGRSGAGHCCCSPAANAAGVAYRRVECGRSRVVVIHPGGDLGAGVIQADEQRLVEKLVAHAAVEALDVAVLHRLARCDVVPLHADLSAPCQHRVAGEFGAIITDDHAGLAAPGDQLGQLANDPTPRDRGIRHRREAFPGHVIARRVCRERL